LKHKRIYDSFIDGTESALKPGEAEEAIPLNVDDDRMSPLKKDTEHLGDQNTGLEKVEHKIVKGAPPLERVDSTRVYLKVKRDLDEDQLYQLVAYLEHSIAVPNELFFDDFQFDGDQLSFRVSRSNALRSHNTKRQLSSVEGIAEAVYKRRKDIETLSGVRVDETGIGSGEGVVPVESEGRDGLFMPILVICAFTITALFTVLAVHQIKQRQRNRRCTAITDVAEQIEGKPSALYQDLCRHRMSTQEQSSGTNSKHSSTSSWSEEPISHSNMDISTGHVILGVVLIVNLANDDDDREQRCTRYWPESGSQLHGAFEIHLVSEHIWSEDYLVRSFYLKNVKTNETRTITQFHYVTWPYQSVPSTTKALLEFRRKVNKSYRGHAAPIVVHCSDGIGRTGAYCLLDIVLNRITKGVKELNIAGSLEHLRDQRSGMVETGEQYKMVFSCLAEEVTAMVKALPH
uniref:IA2 (inferred by orthology to a C. elegans protein) n=1 Tax=Anisakis simplex TaxID=6269 RepID=A0A0M3K473_ANISI